MLDSFRRGQRWLTLITVSFIGAVFVFFMGVGGGFGPSNPTGNAVVQLGDIRLQVSDFQRIRAQQEESMRARLGEQFEARAMQSFIDSQALQSMLELAVMAESASELGMVVGRQEVQRLVRQSPAFRDEAGAFDRDRFVDFAKYEYGSQRVFLEMIRQDLLRQKMIGLIYDQASVSEAEARDAALYQLEEVRIGYVAIDRRKLPAQDALDDEAVRRHLEANHDALQASYDARIEEFTQPEKVRARHILVRIGDDSDEEGLAAARAKAEQARERILAGEAFEDVAKELSDDPGTRDQGGDLGFFARGVNARELEDAAFALDPGDLSDLIRSAFGFHLIRVDERELASTRPFSEVGIELARSEAELQAAEERARALVGELIASIEAGASLEEAARARELSLERPGVLRRRPDGFVPGLGGAQELMRSAFTLSLERPSSTRAFEVGDRLVLIQLLERKLPGSEELGDAIGSQQKSLLVAKRNRMLQDWFDQRRQQLEEQGRLLVNSELVISSS